MPIYLGNTNINISGIQAIYAGSSLVYSSGGTVTYYIDTNKVYTEKFKVGDSVLSPTSFVPEVEGYTFLGWTEQNSLPTPDILTEKNMEGTSFSLYAVYTKSVTITAYDNSSTPDIYTGTVYYHASTATRYGMASFNITPTDKEGWTTVGWSYTADGFSNNAWNGISTVNDLTIYAIYKHDVYLNYDGNGGTTTSLVFGMPQTVYYNSSGIYQSAQFVLKDNYFIRDDYTFTTWALGGVDGMQYSPGETVSLIETTTAYALWQANELEVYSATYSGSYMETGTVETMNETYIDASADYHYWNKHQGTVGENSTKNGTLLSLTEAAKEFKYAKITLAYCILINYGVAQIGYRLNTDTEFTYLTQSATDGIQTAEIVIDLSNVDSVMYQVYLLNNSSAQYWLVSGAIGVQSVVLTNVIE